MEFVNQEPTLMSMASQNDFPQENAHAHHPNGHATKHPDKKALPPSEIAEKERALKDIKDAIHKARQQGLSQQEIAKTVLDSIGLIMGSNPFIQSKGMAGWGGG